MTEQQPLYESEEPRLRWPENPEGCPINPEEAPAPYEVEHLIATPVQKLERMFQHFHD